MEKINKSFHPISPRIVDKKFKCKKCPNEILLFDVPYICNEDMELVHYMKGYNKEGKQISMLVCTVCGYSEKYFPKFGLDFLGLEDAIGKPRHNAKSKKRKEIS